MRRVPPTSCCHPVGGPSLHIVRPTAVPIISGATACPYLHNTRFRATFIGGSTQYRVYTDQSTTCTICCFKHRRHFNLTLASVSRRMRSVSWGRSPIKKNVYFWALPESGGRGETPARIFSPFFTK